MAQPAVSNHLKILEEAELVTYAKERDGLWVNCRLDDGTYEQSLRGQPTFMVFATQVMEGGRGGEHCPELSDGNRRKLSDYLAGSDSA